jgi:hypothetical protein
LKSRPSRNAGVSAPVLTPQLARLLGIEESKPEAQSSISQPESKIESEPSAIIPQVAPEKPKSPESSASQATTTSGKASNLKVKAPQPVEVVSEPVAPPPVVVETGIVTGIVNKRWIQSEGCFDFGPLVVGKDPSLKNVDLAKSPSAVSTSAALLSATVKAVEPKSLVASPLVRAASVAVFETASAVPLPAASKVTVVPKVLPDYLGTVRKINAAVFRISNAASVQALHVEFSFKNDIKQPLFVPTLLFPTTEVEAVDPKKKLDKANGAVSSRKAVTSPLKDVKKNSKKSGLEEAEESTDVSVFSCEPTFMELAAGETRDLIVWAFPQVVGLAQDTLVCSVKNNPEPVLFPVSCIGAIPQLQLSAATVEFERLLIDQHSYRSVILENPSAIPVAWALRAPPSLLLLNETDLGLVSSDSKSARRTFLPTAAVMPSPKKDPKSDTKNVKPLIPIESKTSALSPALVASSSNPTSSAAESPIISPLPIADIVQTADASLKSGKSQPPRKAPEASPNAPELSPIQPETLKSLGQYGVFPFNHGVLQPFSSQRLVFKFTAIASAVCILPLTLEYGDVDGVWPSPATLK